MSAKGGSMLFCGTCIENILTKPLKNFNYLPTFDYIYALKIIHKPRPHEKNFSFFCCAAAFEYTGL